MKKKNKLIVSLLAVSALLSGCSGNSDISGTYSFRMGKENGTNIGAVLNLEKEAFVTENEDLKKELEGKNACNFSFKMEVADMNMGETSDVISIIKEMFGDNINGYYYPEQIEGRSNTKLNLGIPDFLGAIIPGIVITPDMIDEILYASIEGKNVNMAIPVSMQDVNMNLCWYGSAFFDLDCADASLIVKKLNFDNTPNAGKFDHRPGGKINEEGINAMNKDFRAQFCRTVVQKEIDGKYVTVAGLCNENYLQPDEEIGTRTHIYYYPDYTAQGGGSISGENVRVLYTTGIGDLLIREQLDCILTISAGNNSYVTAVTRPLGILPIDLKEFQGLINDPFVFRLPHVVNVGLAKE